MVAANSPESLPLAESVAADGTTKSAATNIGADDSPSRHEIAEESSATSISKSSVAVKKKVTFMDVDGVERHAGDNEAEQASSNAIAQSEPLAAAAAAAAASSSNQMPPSAAHPASGTHDDAAHAARAVPAGDRVIFDAAHDAPVDAAAVVDDKDPAAAASQTQQLDGAANVGCAHRGPNLKRLIEVFGEKIRGKIRGDCGVDDGGDEYVTRLVRWLLHTLVGSSSSGGGGIGNHGNTVTPCSNIGSSHAEANADQAAAVSVECDSHAVRDARGNVAAPAKAAAAAESFGTEVTVATTPVVTFEMRGYCFSCFVPIGLQFCRALSF